MKYQVQYAHGFLSVNPSPLDQPAQRDLASLGQDSHLHAQLAGSPAKHTSRTDEHQHGQANQSTSLLSEGNLHLRRCASQRLAYKLLLLDGHTAWEMYHNGAWEDVLSASV